MQDNHTPYGKTKLFQAWWDIKKRCTNPNVKSYKHYGGRGIAMFPAWANDFLAFRSYVSTLTNCNTPGYSIDRIDNDGNYEPGNLRFVTQAEQNRNRRNNVMLTYQGRTQCIMDWAREIGLTHEGIRDRIRRGLPIDKILARKV